jgi:hypothetical protein
MMRSTQKLLSIAILAAIFGLSSCSDNDSDDKLSKDAAQGKLKAFNTSAASDLQDLTDTDGLTAVKDLFNLVDTDDPFTSRIGTDKQRIKTFFRTKGKEFKKVFAPNKVFNGRTADDEPFEFESKVGVYTWNPESEQFAKTGESDIISILFPTEGSETNNAELQINGLSDVQLIDTDTEETYYNPTLIDADLFVNEVKVASLDFEAAWNADGTPTSADISVFVTPYTASVSFGGTATTATISTSLKKDQETLVAASVTVTYDDESKSDESINKLDGYVQLKNIKVQGNIDVNAADASQTGDPNDYVNLSLYADNKKVGDIVFVKEEVPGSDDEFVPYVQYNNGDKEKLEDLLEAVIAEIDELTDDLDDNG